MGAYGDKYDLMIDRNIRKAFKMGFTREVATHPNVVMAKNEDEFLSGICDVLNEGHEEGLTDEEIPAYNAGVYFSVIGAKIRKKGE